MTEIIKIIYHGFAYRCKNNIDDPGIPQNISLYSKNKFGENVTQWESEIIIIL
jgi:hypothetical protein